MRIYAAILLLIAALYTWLGFVTPFYLDDLMFMGEWIDNAGSSAFSFGGFADFFTFTRGYDNSRIANLIAPFSSLISPFREIFPIVNGCAYALLVMFVQWLSCNAVSARNSILLILSWFCIILFLPWYDSIMIFDYTLNYVWSGVAALGFIYILLKGEQKGWSGLLLAAGLVMAVLAGGFHEAYGLATFCGVSLLILCRHGRVSLQMYLLTAVLLISTLVFFLGEGMIERFQYATSRNHHFPGFRVWCVAVASAIPYLCAAFFKTGRIILRKTVSSGIFLICIGIAVSGYVIGYFTMNAPRCYFFANIAMIIIMLNMLFNLSSEKGLERLKETLIWRIGAGVLAALCVFQTLGVIYWQKKYGDESRRIYALLEESPSGMVYYDLQESGFPPRYTLGMPVYNAKIWNSYWQLRALNQYLKRPFLSLVPSALHDFIPAGKAELDENLEDIAVIDGNAAALYYLQKYPIAPGKISDYGIKDTPVPIDVKVTLTDGNIKEKEATFSPFIIRNPKTEKNDTLVFINIPDLRDSAISRLDFVK